MLGILLAAAAAYMLSRFDRRLRSLASIEEAFQTPILSALPAVRRPLVRTGGEPAPLRGCWSRCGACTPRCSSATCSSTTASARPRLILFLSADAGDGKSTLLANLALVQRDAGARVAVIEADMRRPVQAGLLGVNAPYGLSDVLAGALSLGEAWQSAMHLQTAAAAAPGAAQGLATAPGAAQGLATAPPPRHRASPRLPGPGTASPRRSAPAPGLGVGAAQRRSHRQPARAAGGERMRGVLRSAAEDFDYVLIDAPPPLQVSDVMPLLGLVDGIVIVVRVGHTHEASAQRLMQLLARVSSAPVLGVLANCRLALGSAASMASALPRAAARLRDLIRR